MTPNTYINLRVFEALTGNVLLIKADAPAYTVVGATQGYLAISGRSKDDLIDKELFDIFPSNPGDPADKGQEEVRLSFDKVVATKAPHIITSQRYDVLNPQQVFVERYWTITNNPVLTDSGEVAFIVHSVEETTGQVLASKLRDENQLLTSEKEYLQKLINLFPNPLQVLEPIMVDGQIVDFQYKMTNASYAAYANAAPEDLRGKRVGDVFPGYFQTSSFHNIVAAYTYGISNTWEIHYNVDGLDIHNEMTATKMEGEVVVHFTEFTKLKNLQLELEKKLAELQRSNSHLEEFAHAASHDLKEPVRKIQVFTSLLKTQLQSHLGDMETSIFKKIEQANIRMGALIDDLLQYSHISYKPVSKEVVDLNYLVNQVLEDLEVAIEQKSALITLEPLPSVHGFKRQLQQLIQNLVSNALKYSREGVTPLIEISAETLVQNDKPHHVLAIKDNGIGFEQEYGEKIFQMFARLHGKAEYGGTGIGLSIVKKVVENHEGWVTATGRVGEGSVFCVYLPVTD